MIQRVIVLGSGYGGLMAALRLARKTRHQQVEITLVNAANVFVERVRGHQHAANQRLKRHSLTAVLRGTGVRFVEGMVTRMLPEARQVVVETAHGEQTLGYNKLVYALGSMTDRGRVPGVQQHAYTLDWQSAADLRAVVPGTAARGGRLVIVGGGTTGIEAAAEFAESYPTMEVMFLTRGALAGYLSAKGQQHVRRVFDRLGVVVREQVDVTRVEANQVVLADGAAVAFDLCLWTGGFSVPALAGESGLTVNERGQILIDRYMRSLSHPEIYAVGDASYPAQTPGAPIRMACYTAMMMGTHGADCLAAELQGERPLPFGLAYAVLCISLGRRNGLVQFLHPNDTPRDAVVTGLPAAWMKEALVRLTIWNLKIQRLLPGLISWPGKNRVIAASGQGPRPIRT